MPEPLHHIVIAGDSTAADYNAIHHPMMGWGQALKYFVEPNVKVMNFARGGSSTKSFRAEGHFKALLKEIGEGDLVFIQFGHNDQKVNEPAIYVPLNEFIDNLERMAVEVRSRKGVPVLLTSFPRCVFGTDGTLSNTHGEYPAATRKAAEKAACPLIDANRIAAKRFANPLEAFRHFTYPAPGGHGFVKGAQDISHFNIYGAHEMAKLVVDELQRLAPDLSSCFSKRSP